MPGVMQDKIIFSQKDFPLECSLGKSGSAAVSLWHEILEMKYVVSGRVTVMIDTETVSAGAGDIIFINPYEVHSNLPMADEQGTYHLFMLDLDFFSTVGMGSIDLRTLMLEKRTRFRNLIQNSRAGEILLRIAKEHAENGAYSRLSIVGLLLELFAVLLTDEVRDDAQALSLEDRVKFYKAVEPAVVKLRDDYRTHFSGDELAESCSMNRYHFCRVFKRAMGMTPVQYQNECRLRIADILLKNGSLSISGIAAQVGFRDEAYFSRAYKKSRGISPKEAKSKLSK